MSVIYEPTRAERWLATKLGTDPILSGLIAGRIYAGVAPQGVASPFVTFTMLAAPSAVMGNGTTIVWQKLVYLVKAVTKGNSASSLQTIADRIVTVLHATRGGTSDAAIDYCIRLRPFRMETIENNERWQHLGCEVEMAVRASDV